MQGKAAERMGDREEKRAAAAEHRAYRAEDIDTVPFSLDVGEHTEERYHQVIRARCLCGIEVGGDQQTLIADGGGRGLMFQRLARVGRYVISTHERVRCVQERHGVAA